MVKNKVVVITGASQGLGKELALQLAKLGAKIALVSRTEKDLELVKEEITKSGGEAEYFVGDVANLLNVEFFVGEIIKHFGDIDILINNAGIWTTTELEKARPELIEGAFKVNSLGTIYCTRTVLPILKKKNFGHILNVISKAGLDIPENKDWPTYSATKWAITGYTKALVYALADTDIKVSGFYPAGFESNIFETAGEVDAHDQPWMMRTEDVAATIIKILDTPEDLYIKSIEVSNI